MQMQRRHFLVREYGGEYKLREIESTIGQAIQQVGIPTGNYYAVESIHWTFYFMNCNVTPYRADEIASELTQQFLAGERL